MTAAAPENKTEESWLCLISNFSLGAGQGLAAARVNIWARWQDGEQCTDLNVGSLTPEGGCSPKVYCQQGQPAGSNGHGLFISSRNERSRDDSHRGN